MLFKPFINIDSVFTAIKVLNDNNLDIKMIFLLKLLGAKNTRQNQLKLGKLLREYGFKSEARKIKGKSKRVWISNKK